MNIKDTTEEGRTRSSSYNNLKYRSKVQKKRSGWSKTASIFVVFLMVGTAGTILLTSSPHFSTSGSRVLPQVSPNGNSTYRYLVKSTMYLSNGTVSSGNQLPASSGISPHDIPYDPENGNFYISEYSAEQVAVVNATTNHFVTNISLGYNPTVATYDPANGNVYVADYNYNNGANPESLVSVVNTTSNTILSTIPVGTQPNGILYNPVNNDMYVSNMQSSTVSIISSTNNTVVSTLNSSVIGVEPARSAYDPLNGYIYIPDNSNPGTVSIINATTNALVTPQISTGDGSFSATYDPSNGLVYVSNMASSNVSVIDGTTVIKSIGVGSQPQGIGYNPINQDLYVANQNSNNLTVINGSTNIVVANVNTGAGPYTAGYNPVNGFMYVPEQTSDTLSIIQSAMFYKVYFTETGLPSGTPWYVNITGQPSSGALTGTSYTTSVTNGSYNYSIGTSSKYYESQGGTFTIDGAAISQAVSFKPVPKYSVTFTESGLPSGTMWYVDIVGNQSYSSTTSTITVDLYNGTYSYSTSSQNMSYNSAPGKFTLNGFALGITVPYSTGSATSPSVLNTKQTLFLSNGTTTSGNIVSTNFTLMPQYIAYDKSNGNLYITVSGRNEVYVLNGNTSAIVAKIGVGAFPYGIAYDSSNGYIYVTNDQSSNVTVINGANNSVVGNINVSYSPVGIAYDSSNDYIYVANTQGNSISVINGANNSVVGNINLNTGAPFGLVYDPSNGYIYVANQAGHDVIVINGSNNTVIGNVNVGTDPWGITYDSSNGYVYVVNQGSGNVSIINGSTNNVVGTVKVGSSPWSIEYNPANNYIYVSNYNSANVTVFNGTSNKVVANIAVGYLPKGVTYNPANGYVYVANYGSSTLSMIGYVKQYIVYFTETGLPSGTNWYLNITGGLSYSSTAPTIAVDFLNGTYSYSTSSQNKMYTSIDNSVTVSGSNLNVAVPYHKTNFTVSFTETGLPSGTMWYVNITGGQSLSSTTSTITTYLVNGTYDYTVATTNKTFSSSGGNFVVSGTSVPVAISFEAVNYSVTFTETGLAKGVDWSVTMNGLTNTSDTNSLTFEFVNGTYAYSVNQVLDYKSSVSNGFVTISGAAKAIAISYTSLNYTVTFTDSGLPAGTSWSVVFNGVKNTSTSSTMSFTAPNGTYAYSVSNLTEYYTADYSGTVKIGGSSISESIAFSHYSYINITMDPANSTLYINGVKEQVSSNGLYNITETAGTYNITVKDSGYKTFYDNFTLAVGHTEIVNATLNTTSAPKQNVPPNNNDMYIIAGGVAATAAAFIAIVFATKRRKKD